MFCLSTSQRFLPRGGIPLNPNGKQVLFPAIVHEVQNTLAVTLLILSYICFHKSFNDFLLDFMIVHTLEQSVSSDLLD